MADLNLSVAFNPIDLQNAINSVINRQYNIRGINTSSIRRPLGSITAAASEFEKSMEAANARVLAFGATAGSIYVVKKAFDLLVSSTVDVERQMVEINSILGLTSKQLGQFSSDIFSAANSVSVSFADASKAALEFARQGLSVEETLRRTRDSLILARVAGMDFSDSAMAITAALNSFSNEVIKSTDLVDRLTNADANFAVSAGDLAEAIKRVGSSAADANVSLNETIALVTAAQQTTSRGGAVIGNSFKTIFTRLSRGSVLNDLEALGISTKNASGDTLPLIQVLKNLSSVYESLGSSQKSFVAELVGGVYQINILKATLGDLGKSGSVFNSVLRTVENSTGSAERRIDQLNQSLSARLNVTLNRTIELAAAIGNKTIAPVFKGVLGDVNNTLRTVSESVSGEDIGSKIADGMLGGIKGFLQGPGAAMIGFFATKLAGNFGGFVKDSLSSFGGVNSAAQQQALIQSQILGYLRSNPQVLETISSATGTVSQRATVIANAHYQTVTHLRQQNALMNAQNSISQQMAQRAYAGGARVIPARTTPITPAAGFIPNFNSQEAGQVMENVGAREHKGGYTAGTAYRTTVHDGNGNAIPTFVNSREKVETFTNSEGHLATKVTPPNGFGKGTMYGARGFVPNFAEGGKGWGKFTTGLLKQAAFSAGEYLMPGFGEAVNASGLDKVKGDDVKNVAAQLSKPVIGKNRRAYNKSLLKDQQRSQQRSPPSYSSMPALAAGGFIPNFASLADYFASKKRDPLLPVGNAFYNGAVKFGVTPEEIRLHKKDPNWRPGKNSPQNEPGYVPSRKGAEDVTKIPGIAGIGIGSYQESPGATPQIKALGNSPESVIKKNKIRLAQEDEVAKQIFTKLQQQGHTGITIQKTSELKGEDIKGVNGPASNYPGVDLYVRSKNPKGELSLVLSQVKHGGLENLEFGKVVKSFDAAKELPYDKRQRQGILPKNIKTVLHLEQEVIKKAEKDKTGRKKIAELISNNRVNLSRGFVPNFNPNSNANSIKGRNTFQTKWMMEKMKKDKMDESHPDFMKYFGKMAVEFGKPNKYPSNQLMFGLSGGFVPNLARLYHAGDLYGGGVDVNRTGGFHAAQKKDIYNIGGSLGHDKRRESDLYEITTGKIKRSEMMRYKDTGKNSPRDYIDSALEQKIITKKEYGQYKKDTASNKSESDGQRLANELLKSKGIRGITYTNTIEGATRGKDGAARFAKSMVIIDESLIERMDKVGSFQNESKGNISKDLIPKGGLRKKDLATYSKRGLKRIGLDKYKDPKTNDYDDRKRALGLSGGFVPNFNAIDRSMKEERSHGKGAKLNYDPEIGPFVSQPGQGSTLAEVMRYHPEGLSAAISNSKKSQGLSGGFIPNFAEDDSSSGFLTLSSALMGSVAAMRQTNAISKQNTLSLQANSDALRAAGNNQRIGNALTSLNTQEINRFLAGGPGSTDGLSKNAERALKVSNRTELQNLANTKGKQDSLSKTTDMSGSNIVASSMLSMVPAGIAGSMSDGPAKAGAESFGQAASFAGSALMAFPGHIGATIAAVTLVVGGLRGLYLANESLAQVAIASAKTMKEQQKNFESSAQQVIKAYQIYQDAIYNSAIPASQVAKLTQEVAVAMEKIPLSLRADFNSRMKLAASQEERASVFNEMNSGMIKNQEVTENLANSQQKGESVSQYFKNAFTGRENRYNTSMMFGPNDQDKARQKMSVDKDVLSIVSSATSTQSGTKKYEALVDPSKPAKGLDEFKTQLAALLPPEAKSIIMGLNQEEARLYQLRMTQIEATRKQSEMISEVTKKSVENERARKKASQDEVNFLRERAGASKKLADSFSSMGISSANTVKSGKIDAQSKSFSSAANTEKKFVGAQTQAVIDARTNKVSSDASTMQNLMTQNSKSFEDALSRNEGSSKTEASKSGLSIKESKANLAVSEALGKVDTTTGSPQEILDRVKAEALRSPGGSNAKDISKRLEDPVLRSELAKNTAIAAASLKVNEAQEREQAKAGIIAARTEQNIKAFGGIENFLSKQKTKDDRKEFNKAVRSAGSGNADRSGRGSMQLILSAQKDLGGSLSEGSAGALKESAVSARARQIRQESTRRIASISRSKLPQDQKQALIGAYQEARGNSRQMARNQVEEAAKLERAPLEQVKRLDNIARSMDELNKSLTSSGIVIKSVGPDFFSKNEAMARGSAERDDQMAQKRTKDEGLRNSRFSSVFMEGENLLKGKDLDYSAKRAAIDEGSESPEKKAELQEKLLRATLLSKMAKKEILPGSEREIDQYARDTAQTMPGYKQSVNENANTANSEMSNFYQEINKNAGVWANLNKAMETFIVDLSTKFTLSNLATKLFAPPPEPPRQRPIIGPPQPIPPNNTGGYARGISIPTQRGGDDLLATLQRGEVVIPANKVKDLGPDFFANAGIPGFARGGSVSRPLSMAHRMGLSFNRGTAMKDAYGAIKKGVKGATVNPLRAFGQGIAGNKQGYARGQTPTSLNMANRAGLALSSGAGGAYSAVRNAARATVNTSKAFGRGIAGNNKGYGLTQTRTSLNMANRAGLSFNRGTAMKDAYGKVRNVVRGATVNPLKAFGQGIMGNKKGYGFGANNNLANRAGLSFNRGTAMKDAYGKVREVVRGATVNPLKAFGQGIMGNKKGYGLGANNNMSNRAGLALRSGGIAARDAFRATVSTSKAFGRGIAGNKQGYGLGARYNMANRAGLALRSGGIAARGAYRSTMNAVRGATVNPLKALTMGFSHGNKPITSGPGRTINPYTGPAQANLSRLHNVGSFVGRGASNVTAGYNQVRAGYDKVRFSNAGKVAGNALGKGVLAYSAYNTYNAYKNAQTNNTKENRDALMQSAGLTTLGLAGMLPGALGGLARLAGGGATVLMSAPRIMNDAKEGNYAGAVSKFATTAAGFMGPLGMAASMGGTYLQNKIDQTDAMEADTEKEEEYNAEDKAKLKDYQKNQFAGTKGQKDAKGNDRTLLKEKEDILREIKQRQGENVQETEDNASSNVFNPKNLYNFDTSQKVTKSYNTRDVERASTADKEIRKKRLEGGSPEQMRYIKESRIAKIKKADEERVKKLQIRAAEVSKEMSEHKKTTAATAANTAAGAAKPPEVTAQQAIAAVGKRQKMTPQLEESMKRNIRNGVYTAEDYAQFASTGRMDPEKQKAASAYIRQEGRIKSTENAEKLWRSQADAAYNEGDEEAGARLTAHADRNRDQKEKLQSELKSPGKPVDLSADNMPGKGREVRGESSAPPRDNANPPGSTQFTVNVDQGNKEPKTASINMDNQEFVDFQNKMLAQIIIYNSKFDQTNNDIRSINGKATVPVAAANATA